MRAYLAIIRIVITALSQYRAAFFVKILTHIFWGLIHVSIITAFYAGALSPQPISLTQTISLVWLGQGLLLFLPWMIDPDIEEQIKNGNIAYELTRPINLYWMLFFRSAAARIIPSLFNTIPILLFSGAFYTIDHPSSFASVIAFSLSVGLAILLSAAMTTFILTTLFWTISGEGIKKLLPNTCLFFSGVVVPLPLFPSWLQPFLNFQPLRGIVDIPSRIYTGIIPATDAYLYLGFQFAWALGCIIAGQWLMRQAMKRFIIQGG